MTVYFDSWVVPMGIKHNEIDESECIRSGFKKKTKQNTKIVQDNKRIFILCLCLLRMIHWIWFR
jgi:hypothetical protein